MYIGRLQLKGFKSFGGSHDLILSSGFTAIVGPNGSGKSNLLDALRWSLGDSHAGRLRISRQSDLLFQGSISLPTAKEGEVLLQIRDEDRTCNIKRRVMAPDGNTLLMVDNVRRTLTELDQTKREWNLDGIKFAFIGQGEVAEVIQERPLARRMRLESLFGIDVYRKRRTDAADRLVTVKEEYERLRTFMSELTARREEIAPEVARAAQLREILDTLEDERKLLYWMRRARAEEMLEKIRAELLEAEQQRKNLMRWSRLWQHGIDTLEAELTKISQMRQQQTWELEQCRNQFSTLTKSGYASANTLMTSNARLIQARLERESAKKHLDGLLSEQKKSDDENKKAKSGLDETQKKLDAVEKKWQEYNELREKEKEQRAEWNKEKGNLEAELQQIRARLEFLGKDLLDLRTKKSEAPDQKKEIDAQIKDLEDNRDILLKEQNVLVTRHTELYAKCQTLAAELQRARREAQQARSKFNDVTDAVQSELYPRPVQYLLSAAKLNRLNAAPRAVIDVFTCDTKLSLALEAYLGSRAYQLLVEDLEEAGRCIDMLKVNSAGRATFLPLERCKPRFPDKGHRLPSGGVVGWAIDLVTVENHWLPAIQQIMGDLLIVENYAVGQGLVRSGFRGPVATLEGDVFQPGGTVSGGRNVKQGKSIEMKSQLAILEKEAARTKEAAEKLDAEFKKSEAEELEVSEKKEVYTRQIRELDGRVALLMDQRESITKEEKRMAGERGRILETLKESGVQHKNTLAALAELEEKWNRPSTIEDDSKLIEERERLRAEVAVAAERMRSGFALMERVSTEIRTEERKVWSLDEEISELDQRCVLERANLGRVGKGCLEIHERKKRLVEEIDKHVGGFSKLESRREYMRKRQANAEAKARTDMDAFTRLDAKKGETERELEELLNTWEEQYPYPGPDVLPDDVNLEELRKKIRDGDRKIKAFGEVDMGVLSEDRNLRDRLAFLGEELDDVRNSATELERLIQEADAQAHKVFSDNLQEVDARFCTLFQHLFGGGEAHLEMLDGETIWDTGVDVVARPPGKHPQGINQLSGGEQSLAAISLLFASMEVANCPLAVLDEVDAALDEVNLRRFAELAKEYAKNRQILAMTHRRVTMERADVLYGVTLQEPGLSQVIGVKLDDWA
ncbi:chromosome segregation protein SMC [Synergistaceae bacterium OttesenSCG-928-D05]|nr:chromosome segregation protein SMC [Synergistaceae bacterium OttesenSCG-928-D05]